MKALRPLFLMPALLALAVLTKTSAKTVLLGESDSNTRVCLTVGDTVRIKLPSNPTTGYSWANPEALAIVELIASHVEKPATNRVGASGYQVFTFKASSPGEAELVLNYLRPFEKGTPPAKTFRLAVSVEQPPLTH